MVRYQNQTWLYLCYVSKSRTVANSYQNSRQNSPVPPLTIEIPTIAPATHPHRLLELFLNILRIRLLSLSFDLDGTHGAREDGCDEFGGVVYHVFCCENDAGVAGCGVGTENDKEIWELLHSLITIGKGGKGKGKTYTIESGALVCLWTTAFLHCVDEILALVSDNSQRMKPSRCIEAVC